MANPAKTADALPVALAAGIKRLTLHKLRHTFASLLISRNVPITKVSKILGHRDPVITLKVYAHFIEDKKERRAGAGE